MSADAGSLLTLAPLELDGFETGQLEHVLIEAPAGFGKTFLLRRTATELSHSMDTFFVTCSTLPTGVLEAPVAELMSRVVAEALGPEAVERFHKLELRNQSRLLVLDGLNEIAVDHRAIDRLLHQATMASGLRVLASQRPAITLAAPKGYTLGFLLPLKPQFVAKAFGEVDAGAMRLLRIPLFFQLGKAQRIVATTQAEAVRTYFVQCLLGLPQFAALRVKTLQAQADELAGPFLSIGKAAVEIYRDMRSTSAPKEFFSEGGLFDEIGGFEGALAAGFAVEEGNLIRFRHQLFHDWAIANYYHETNKLLADEHPRSDLEIVTLSRRSTDALELLAQMYALTTPEKAEKAVLEIYDWDYPAALATLLSWVNVATPQGPLPPPSTHLEVAIFSLIAEKAFDLFQHTVQRFETLRSSVEPVLRTLLPALPENYRLADLERAVGEADLGQEAPRWYESWVRAFSTSMPFPELLTLLQSDEGVLGWTASNVLARSALTEEQPEVVVDLFQTGAADHVAVQDQFATIRWRLVHAVGRTGAAISFLSDVVRDQGLEKDVRYGAVRSLCAIGLSPEAEVAESAINTVSSLDREGLLATTRVSSAILRCAIPAKGILPPSVGHWVASFRTMLDDHRVAVEGSEPDEASAWRARIEELEAWSRAVSEK